MQVNIHYTKTHLSELVELALQGEEIILAKAGKPLLKLVPIEKKPIRKPGRLAGKISFSDDFDAPMTEEELAEWYNGDIFP